MYNQFKPAAHIYKWYACLDHGTRITSTAYLLLIISGVWVNKYYDEHF